jgi:hypothetical protein
MTLVLVLCVAAAFLVFNAVRYRGQPEPQNNPIKLPLMVLVTAFFGVLLVKGENVVLSSAFIVLGVMTIGCILGRRNPWWMQGPADRWRLRERSRP